MGLRMLQILTTECGTARSSLHEALGVLLAHNRSQLLLRGQALLAERIWLRLADAQALGHLGILVSVVSQLLWASLHLVLVQGVLHSVGLVDIEGEILLQFLNFAISNLDLLEVLLGLRLQGTVRLHEVIVELDELLHLL